MHQSSLLALLRRFSLEEWKSFGKFLHSPYHNANKRLPVFYDYLNRHRPAFSHPELERQATWRAMYGEAAPFEGAVLRVLMAAMHKAAEQFLIAEQLRSNDMMQARLLAEAFSQHQLYARFVQTTESALKNIDAQPGTEMEGLLDAFLLNVNLHFHPETNGLSNESLPLREALRRLDEFYAFAKLRLSVELSARANLLSEEAEYPLLSPLMDYAEATLAGLDPAIRLYLLLLKINLEGLTAERFFNLKNTFLEQRERLGRQVQVEVLIYLMNFGNSLTAVNSSLFFRELFELNRLGVDGGLFLDNGIFPDIWFTNIAVCASVCREWEWTGQFIREQAAHLSLEIAADAVSLANAFLFFYQGRFDAAYGLLADIPDTDMGYQLRRQSLSLRCLFEMMLKRQDLLDLVEAKTEAFDKFLRRQKVFSRGRISAELHFARIMRKMVRACAGPDGAAAQWQSILEETEATIPLVSKNWLLEKQRLMLKKGTG
ncbi:MAG: hypothetical protein KDC75_04525 [Phaeodactylibacter sp.]|nr:hypothetical protein [Phaeodactylibacter sp.]